MSDPRSDSEAGYELPDLERPASAAPSEQELNLEGASVPALDYSPPPPAHDAYAALRHRDYRIFTVGWLVSVVGTHVQSTAVAWEVFDRTGSKLALGSIAGMQVLPLLLLAIPAGHMADTFDRRRLIAGSMIGAAACSIGMAMLSYQPGALPWLFVLLGLNSAFLVIGRPARSSLLPLIVPPAVFPNAVTWNASFFQISSMGGPALGGVLVALSLARWQSVSVAYVVDACSNLVLAVLVLMVRTRAIEPSGQAVDRSVLAGFRFVWRTKVLLGTMTLDLFAVMLGGATYLLPVFAKDILQVGPTGFGWLRAGEATGAFVTTLIIAHLPPMKHAGRNMLLAVVGFGIVTIIFGLSRNFWLSFSMLVLLGACDSVSVVVRHTLVQVLTPDAMRGRVSAVNNISIGASNELGGVESGVLAALIGAVPAVVVGGIGAIMTVAIVAAVWPQLRHYGALHQPLGAGG
jgi:MFS family permease